VFITALFTIAMFWKQPRCPTSDEWIMKTWHIYTMGCYSAIRNNDTWLEGKWMQLEDITLCEVSQDQKHERQCFLSYFEDRYKDKHIHKNKHDLRHTQMQNMFVTVDLL
jgi:hypothetical protein